MSTYVIGDVQGCYYSLLQLLDRISYDPKHDSLWFVGDLINRGKHSLETLRFIKSLDDTSGNRGRIVSVMGNHDIGLLAVAKGAYPYDPDKYTFQDILDAPDREELLHWLQTRPLLFEDISTGWVLVHAGLYPLWSLEEARLYAREIEQLLSNKEQSITLNFFSHLYGNHPTLWDPKLEGYERWRFIINCFLRMRFCNMEGVLDFSTKESATKAPPGWMPWFKVPNRKTKSVKILFGHWAALNGQTDDPEVIALDTGCVWGGTLTAFHLETLEKIAVPAEKSEIFKQL